jgi:predicted nucleic acid-binding protein
MHALFDGDILIDYLNGIVAAKDELGRYESRAISVITWMEVLAGAPPAADVDTRSFLDQFKLLGIDAKISQRAAELRRSKRMTAGCHHSRQRAGTWLAAGHPQCARLRSRLA